MAGSLWVCIVLCSCIFFTNCNAVDEIASNIDELYRAQIWSVLKYLNNDPNREYNYNYGALIEAQNQKDNTIKIKFNARVDCRSNDKYCSKNIQLCEGTVKYDPDQELYITISGAACHPIEQILVPLNETKEPVAAAKNEQLIQASQETAVDGGEQFVAVRAKPTFCAGCPVDLATDVDGLDVLKDLALRHIDSERSSTHTVVKVLRIQQQVVAGIKYILLLEIAPTTCQSASETESTDVKDSCVSNNETETEICEITYLQKPWISKCKHIISNNCTQSQEFLAIDNRKTLPTAHNDFNNEIDLNYNNKKTTNYPSDVVMTNSVPNYDRIANGGNGDDLLKNDMTSMRLAELESQIVYHSANDGLDNSKSTFATTLVSENVDTAPETSTVFSESVDINVELSDQPYSTTTPSLVDSLPANDTSSSEESVKKQPKKKQNKIDSSEESSEETSAHSKKKQNKIDSSEESSEETSPRSKRAAKLEKVSDDEENLVRTLADLSVATLDNIDSDNRKRVVLKILSAKKMRLEGFIYHLKLLIGVSECAEEEGSLKSLNEYTESDEDKCKEQMIKNLTKICKVEIFVDDEKTNAKILKSQCQNIKKEERRHRNRNGRATLGEPVLGGVETLSVTDPRVAELTSHTVKNLNLQTSHETQYKIVEVISVTRQLVAGSLYEIKAKLALTDCSKNEAKDVNDCQTKENPKLGTITIWDQPWLPNGRETNVTLDNNEKYSFRSPSPRRQKRSNGVGGVGGVSQLSLTDPRIEELTSHALNHLDNHTPHQHKYKLTEIVSASSQVVSGSLYKIEGKFSLSDCLKTEQKERSLCKATETPKKGLIKIWDQPWLPQGREVTVTIGEEVYSFKTDSPKPSRRKRSKGFLAGGVRQLNLTDPRIEELTSHALNHLDNHTPHQHKYKLTEIVSASSQVVSGSLYKIEGKFSLSDCLKTEQKERSLCKATETPKKGLIKIWDQPWLPQGREVTVTIGEEVYSFKTDSPKPSRRKRSTGLLAGGVSQLNLTDPRIKELTSHALNNLDNHTPHQHKYKLTEVVSASSQVVSGSLYKIEGKFSLSDCLKTEQKDRSLCKATETPKNGLIKVLDQPWLPQGRQVTVTIGEEVYSFKTDSPKPSRKKRSLLGGAKELKPNDPRIRKLTEPALRELNSQTQHDTKYKIIKVISATSQVVSGNLYKIKVKIALSNCGKEEEIHIDQCQVNEEPKSGIITIWDRPWLKNGKETNITIERDEHEHYSFRSKRSLEFSHHKHALHLQSFYKFIDEHDKVYKDEKEFKYRLKVFKNNMKQAEYMNLHEQGTAKYGPTKFADLTSKEFKKYLGLNTSLKQANVIPHPQAKIPDIEIPVEFDWRDKGAVTNVKNQGQCGSCWAFSVTGNVEGQNAIKHGKLIELSEQELVDCDKMDDGCNGGLMDNAYRAIEQMGGLETEQDYPYDAEDEKCSFNRSLAKVQVSGAVNISSDESEMAKWLVKNGPISIALNANAMQFYMGGVSHPWKFLCSPKNLDHGVLIVGYGAHKYPLYNKTLPYWTIKNSWGTSWGERGYYRIFRGDGTCGVNQMASSAILD